MMIKLREKVGKIMEHNRLIKVMRCVPNAHFELGAVFFFFKLCAIPHSLLNGSLVLLPLISFESKFS
jgi:hypothetical protein